MTLYVMLCTNNSPFLTLRYMTQSYHGRWGNRRADDALTLIFGKVFFFLLHPLVQLLFQVNRM